MPHDLIQQYDGVIGGYYWQCCVCFKDCWERKDFNFKCIPKYPPRTGKAYTMIGKK